MEESIDKCLKIILAKVLCCSMTNDEAIILIKGLFDKKHTVEVPYQPYDPFKPYITYDSSAGKCESEYRIEHPVSNCDMKGGKITTGSYVDGKFTYTEEIL